MNGLEDMVGNADFIISVVPNVDSVREIYMNEAMHAAVKEGAIIIEMTSARRKWCAKWRTVMPIAG